MSRPTLRYALVGLGVVLLALLAQVPASAHPLGNFTVNHFHGLRVHADRVEDRVVVDRAEIPTLQAHGRDDAAALCAEVAASVRLRIDGRAAAWHVTRAHLTYPPGQAKLPTTRVSCALSAPADLGRGGDVDVVDAYGEGTIGWREMTAAAGPGLRLAASDVPARTVSDELRRYPDDLLADPLDVRTARLRVTPGSGPAAGTAADTRAPDGSWVGALDARLAALSADDHLTLPVGLAAVALALLLGAGHAALPGHGKTVMATYMAGRRGGTRDAVLVGATVTFTHTAGVLLLGLALTVSAAFAADRLMSALGVLSGALVCAVGVMLLRDARKGRTRGHTHSHGHAHGHVHGHGDGHGHPHSHEHDTHRDHDLDHDHAHSDAQPEPFRRRALFGMGVAGGLVPSPSALVVLLGAIALNRTAFGVALVLAYGMGMAAVLTAAGMLVARFGERADRMLGGRVRTWRAAMPYVTAALIVAVGAGLALRSAVPLLNS
ncbi:nickel transporter [Streptomyces sp. NPDC050085]|uniref:HoxN/HupN/NixA family nickel/cobalt transporter n=1 Tax=Streptomyces sp. NPDC050085 TaxID=3365600 RepID=UPI00379993CE